jgi:predicted nuclease of predicted toxin-antitoxin system
VRVKLDENLGRREADRLRTAGHDVAMVCEQGMASATDKQLIEACRVERRCLVSLDLDFANPLVFKPMDFAGIAVLRLPSKRSADDLLALVDALAAELAAVSIEGKLWIVERHRIRQYQPEDM